MQRLILLIIITLGLFGKLDAQTITRARFVLSPQAEGFRTIDLEINNRYYLGIGGEGEILYIETKAGAELLDEDCEKLGFPIRYYDKFDIHDIPGRIKSIGNIKITYNNVFDIHEVKGSLKTIGDMAIRYYNTFDIHDPKEKVKSVGKVQIKYYNEFDAGNNFGGIKSVTGNTSALTVSAGRRYKLYSGRG